MRNGVLARFNLVGAGNVAIGTVPAGQTWIVKDIRLDNLGAVLSNVVVYCQSSSGLVTTSVIRSAMNASTVLSLAGFVCMAPGDQLHLAIDAGNVSALVSGADLLGAI